uniref:Uncharacterized protein n=1 Tax=Avena sativa TaxID=4498 RepID=A0ACD5W5C8_AVESA
MSVAVIKSSPVVVYPSEPGPPAGEVHLSSFDQRVPPFAVISLLMFDRPIETPVETIKSALSRALVHYRPVCGRLAGDSVLRIACTDEGVPFVGASASCALEKVTRAMFADLALAYAAPLCSPADALLQMQVTRFSCGGFIVGVTWNHVLADTVGMGQFLQALGELARGMPRPTVVPARSAATVPGIPPYVLSGRARRMEAEPLKGQGVFLDITVPASLIDRVKAECGAHAACTTFDAVTAVLWRCRTRAAVSDPDATAPLVFANNVRELVGAHHGYYGNCVLMQSVRAKRAQVADGDISDLVRLIRRAKEMAPELLAGAGAKAEHGGGDMYNTLAVSSWRRVGLDEADFGGGRPARVMWHEHEERMLIPECIVCPPCKGKDGVNVASLCVKPEHAAAFLAELAAA